MRAAGEPRTVVTWGGKLSPGDTINFYDHAGFHPIVSAVVKEVSEFKDTTMQADAHHLVKDILKARDGDDRPLRRVTLDRDVTVTAADYAENATTNRTDHFTVRNSYFHDSGVRVLFQGFKHGTFENNRFERISGGLALTCDAWWWEGPTCQDIVVRNNLFKDTAFRNAWGSGKAALIIGAGWAEGKGDVSHGCAFHSAVITGNTFTGSSTAAIFISNTDNVIVEKNTIQNAFRLAAPVGAIQLAGVLDAKIYDNTLTGCPGLNISAVESRQISILRNTIRDAYRDPANAPKDLPDALIRILGCMDTQVANNLVSHTNAANVISVKDSPGTVLSSRHSAHIPSPGEAVAGDKKETPPFAKRLRFGCHQRSVIASVTYL